jgi:putative acyl-CoA dehydrogenase
MGPDTTEVINQSPPYEDIDLFGSDRPLQEAVAANGAAQDAPALSAFGRCWGSAEMLEQGRLANENPPKLRAYDAKGFRRDTIEFHPAYHRTMAESIGAGLHAMTWTGDGTRAPAPAEVARAARFYMAAQIETGHLCPLTMTRAAVAALQAAPNLLARLMPKLAARTYDSQFRPWWKKDGITVGMGMTEKQGGTDVRANTTRAERADEHYLLTGHKWFMSAPMCDGFMVLAQAEGGLTCFMLPRFRPDGAVNALRLVRLKDKLGNRSNASAEVEFEAAHAERIGEEGKGVRTIVEMVQLTRLDCAIASAGLMRMALAQALHHARHRSVFQKRLADHPMMRAVLADLALEVEGAVALVMRLCRSLDRSAKDPVEAARARVLTPVVKYWVCKTAPAFVYEAMECLGGNGYVEESLLPRLYREAPVNAIWEGSGNVVVLDLLRAASRDGDATREVIARLAEEAHDLPGARQAAESATHLLADRQAEARARASTERLALLAAAAALKASAPGVISEAFAASRLAQPHGAIYGTPPIDRAEGVLERALPA